MKAGTLHPLSLPHSFHLPLQLSIKNPFGSSGRFKRFFKDNGQI